MTEPTDRQGDAFDVLSAESRVVRSARYMPEDQPLSDAQRRDVADRCRQFMGEHRVTRDQVGRAVGLAGGTVSKLLGHKYHGTAGDRYLARLNNWLELAAQQHNLIGGKQWVETAVARDVLAVVGIVAETCKIGVLFGPAQIGKTFTLQAIEGDARFGSPLLIRVDESRTCPCALCKHVATRFNLSTRGSFDAIFSRLVTRLRGTKRLLIFDEIDRAQYRTLEFLRDLHDETGCPLLLCGKPVIYDRLGFREAGGFKQVMDQLSGRVVVCRDLLERTRDRDGRPGEPLYTLADIRALVGQAGLQLRVTPDAERWLQDRACTLGQGGVGKALVYLYLGAKLAFVQGDDVLTSDHLEAVVDLAMGHEDAARRAAMVADSASMRHAV
ncbi:MAG TPA: AAA family ATPase [Phycisphaerae bacterium]|nr:AAA family ATPase [Phycisphaerae bacterium]HNU46849.1 AAA family ATPase [Phycisphaerae bacterium]